MKKLFCVYLVVHVYAIFASNESVPSINDDLMKLTGNVSKEINKGQLSKDAFDVKNVSREPLRKKTVTKNKNKHFQRHHHKREIFYKPYNNIQKVGYMLLDFNYVGDVYGVLAKLKEYNPNVTILPISGKKKELNINISLQGVKLSDIADAINNQTNGMVNLLYDDIKNSIRLNYTGVIDVGRDAIEESLKWQKGGYPKPILKQDGVVRFPYGEYQPVVTCQPLNLCDIELQHGEEVQSIVIGDSLRWNEGDQGVPIVYSGTGNQLTPHLVLKPSQSGLDTTLMITTSKRTYMLRLKSAVNGYVARVGFYYPGEIIQTFVDNKNKLKNNNNAIFESESKARYEASALTMPLINLSKVNYAYTIKGDDYSWKPTQVFDDGVSVYIQLPDGVNARNLPGLCILVDDNSKEDKCEMVNFRYTERFYIVDKLFNKARLINGYDDYMQAITVTRKSENQGLWSRIFGS